MEPAPVPFLLLPAPPAPAVGGDPSAHAAWAAGLERCEVPRDALMLTPAAGHLKSAGHFFPGEAAVLFVEAADGAPAARLAVRAWLGPDGVAESCASLPGLYATALARFDLAGMAPARHMLNGGLDDAPHPFLPGPEGRSLLQRAAAFCDAAAVIARDATLRQAREALGLALHAGDRAAALFEEAYLRFLQFDALAEAAARQARGSVAKNPAPPPGEGEGP